MKIMLFIAIEFCLAMGHTTLNKNIRWCKNHKTTLMSRTPAAELELMIKHIFYTTSTATSKRTPGMFCCIDCETRLTVLNKKRNAHFLTVYLFFYITKQWDAGKLPLHRRHCSLPLLSLSTLLTILEVPNMDHVTLMKFTQNGTFPPVGFNQTMQLDVCNHM